MRVLAQANGDIIMEGKMHSKRDVFLCHASEDKATVLAPLIRALEDAGISYWYDEAEVRWGDSITKKVNEGLKISRFVIVVLSGSFPSKKWPQRELNSALNIEASSGEVQVLPLLADDVEVQERILAEYPIINDKKYISWDGDPGPVVEALTDRLSTASQPNNGTQASKGRDETVSVPLPRIKKRFTQRDKDLFIKDAFAEIRKYFKAGLAQLKEQQPEVETDLTETHNFKFTATIYLQGEIASRCTIWLGGPISSNSIAFRQGDSGIESDNSYNDWLSVTEQEGQLKLEAAMGAWTSTDGNIFTVEGAAEYLWRRSAEHID
jgi:hypothetical protein